MNSLKVYVSLVTYNSLAQLGAPGLEKCVRSVLAQEGFKAGEDLFVRFSDNASEDGVIAWARGLFAASAVTIRANPANLGFAAAHNQNIKEALEWGADYILILNPDVVLEADAVARMTAALQSDSKSGSAAPRLYRADDQLAAVEPRRFDAAGMYITPALRHFDRGSNELDQGQYRGREYVFGASGACLLLRRAFVEDALLEANGHERAAAAIFPQLAEGRELRALLFDEAFFAYREDADLAWRGQLLGWRCLYVPEAVGYHRRVVLPERRGELAPEINLHGVRNRFLLQLNNFFVRYSYPALLTGLLFRNAAVLCGVCIFERSSFPAFLQLVRLLPRALARRRALKHRMRTPTSEMAGWFRAGAQSSEAARSFRS